MSRLLIEAIGPASSVQDRGRFGAQRYGLTSSGAMDRMGLAIANVLVGSEPGAAAIEIGPLPARFKAEGGDVRLGIAGAMRPLAIAGRAIDLNRSLLLGEGETLEIGSARPGVFSYCAIEGGLTGEPTFGSLSVTARAGIGSPFARVLRAGDAFEVKPADLGIEERRIEPPVPAKGPIRVVLGPQDDYFDQATIEAFAAADWTISLTSDRMGYRLEGPVLTHAKGFNIISDGIVHGAIQIPGSGQPLVLMADRGTTGGYPKIGAVITADLGRLAQIEAAGKVRFAIVSIEEAQRETVAWLEAIAGLRDRLMPIAVTLTSESLLAANLAGGIVHALDSSSWGGFAAAERNVSP